jgi:predicted short-subunit dehydrogenase-like oxidoreductase (DUF2520 family)
MRRTVKKLAGKFRRAGSRSRTPRPVKELSVSIIGAGRLGTALGLALKTAGYNIEVVAARRAAAADRAAKAFGPKTLALSALQLSKLNPDQHDRLNRCSLVFIATPDDIIAPVALQLSEIFAPNISSSGDDKRRASLQRVVLHTSGALAADALEPMRRAGFAVGSLHPLVSISESRSGAKLLARAFFSVEGDPAAIRVGKSIVKDLAGESFTLESSCKALYHAAALTAAPNMTALFEIAVDMLGVCGLRPGRARRILLPLVASTVANLATQDPARALTGTFQRGDVATVQKHLAALRSANLPQALTAYVVLGQRSIAMAKRRGANPAGLDKIARLLSHAAKSPGRR